LIASKVFNVINVKWYNKNINIENKKFKTEFKENTTFLFKKNV